MKKQIDQMLPATLVDRLIRDASKLIRKDGDDVLVMAEALMEEIGKNWNFFGLKKRGFNNSVILQHCGEFEYGNDGENYKVVGAGEHEALVVSNRKMKADRSKRYMRSLVTFFFKTYLKKSDSNREKLYRFRGATKSAVLIYAAHKLDENSVI